MRIYSKSIVCLQVLDTQSFVSATLVLIFFKNFSLKTKIVIMYILVPNLQQKVKKKKNKKKMVNKTD